MRQASLLKKPPTEITPTTLVNAYRKMRGKQSRIINARAGVIAEKLTAALKKNNYDELRRFTNALRSANRLSSHDIVRRAGTATHIATRFLTPFLLSGTKSLSPSKREFLLLQKILSRRETLKVKMGTKTIPMEAYTPNILLILKLVNESSKHTAPGQKPHERAKQLLDAIDQKSSEIARMSRNKETAALLEDSDIFLNVHQITSARAALLEYEITDPINFLKLVDKQVDQEKKHKENLETTTAPNAQEEAARQRVIALLKERIRKAQAERTEFMRIYGLI